MGIFTPGAIIRSTNKIFFFILCVDFSPLHSATKRAAQLDLSQDHMPRAAAGAQKGESSGAV